MSVQVTTEAEITREAWDILLRHMSPSKFVRYWAAHHAGYGNYLKWRDEVFGDQTVDKLYAEIKAYREKLEAGQT